MVPALTIHDIQEHCQNRYDFDEKRIVAIIIARYNIPRCDQIIKQNYNFWHYWTGKALDFYWLGYGAYYFPEQKGQYFVGDYGDEPNVYFDSNVFSEEVAKIESLAKIHYDDTIAVLLCNYSKGRIHLDESAFITIEPLMTDDNQYNLRDFTATLVRECKKSSDVKNVIVKLRLKKASYGLLNMKLSAFVSDGIKALLKKTFGFVFRENE